MRIGRAASLALLAQTFRENATAPKNSLPPHGWTWDVKQAEGDCCTALFTRD